MLSITGQTFGEVFANLVQHDALDDTERTAAQHVAAWLASWEKAEHEYIEACQNGNHAAWETASEERARLRRSMPFAGSGLWVESPREWRTFIVGSVKFRVFPYTTGPTMNVGVDRV